MNSIENNFNKGFPKWPTALLLLCFSCTITNKPVTVTRVENRVHSPQIGLGVLDFSEFEEIYHYDYDSYFKVHKIVDKHIRDSLFSIIELEGKYVGLPEGWYENIFQDKWPTGYKERYKDVDETKLNMLFPSHLINIKYRITTERNDTIYIGDCVWDASPDFLMYNGEYFICKNSFFSTVDSLLRNCWEDSSNGY